MNLQAFFNKVLSNTQISISKEHQNCFKVEFPIILEFLHWMEKNFLWFIKFSFEFIEFSKL